MKQDRRAWTAAVLLVVLAGAALAAGAPRGLATRSVSRYLQLERALQEALATRDRPAALTMLAEGFEVRTAASPDAVAADTWLARELGAARRESVVRELAVHEFGDLAVVSFVLDRPKAGAAFVVDVWRQDRLLLRTIDRPAPLPAPSRPSGRE